MGGAAEFFERLEQQGSESIPPMLRASLRFDLDDGDGQLEHWYMTIDRGQVRVTRDDRPADYVGRTRACVFDSMVSGETNVPAAVFRGDLVGEGDIRLQILFAKLPPSRADARHPRDMEWGDPGMPT